ncbi:MAG: hypothetical protein V1663_00080 [archaeon]
MKTHSREKRNLKLGTHLRHKRRSGIKTKRAKTFKSEEKAIEYCKMKDIKDYELVNLKSEDSKEKKIKIIKK